MNNGAISKKLQTELTCTDDNNIPKLVTFGKLENSLTINYENFTIST